MTTKINQMDMALVFCLFFVFCFLFFDFFSLAGKQGGGKGGFFV
jgi:hypothetical protein